MMRIHPRTSLIARRAAGATTLLFLAAACSGGRKDATADSAAGAAAGTTAEIQSGTSVPAPHSAVVDSAKAAPVATTAGAPAASGAMLDPNAATRDQLVAVPGMTAAAADALIAGRPYSDMVAVDKALVASIPSAATRKTVYAMLWKPIDLNSAKREEILLIPGVGPRMLKEFLEYRPYKAIDEFRREIGKYVDKAELARLEQYVTIR